MILVFLLKYFFDSCIANDTHPHSWSDKVFNQEIVIENYYYLSKDSIFLSDIKNHKLFHSINQMEPNWELRHKAYVNNKLIYDQLYSLKEFGLRLTQQNKFNHSKMHFIVAGDSNTFGQGVDELNSLSNILVSKVSLAHPYNFAIRGSGPHNTLALMQFYDWSKVIKEEKGIFLYNYYDFQIERVIGSRSYIKWNQGNSPFYDLNSNNQIEYKGNFDQRFLSKIFMLINCSEWLSSILPTLPRHRLKHSEIVAKIFSKINNLYRARFPNGKFIVALNYTFDELLPNRLNELKELLKNEKIDYVIINSKIDEKEHKFFGDGHLNSEGHKVEANAIWTELQKIIIPNYF